MEKIEGIMGKLFVAAATLGGIACLARADYNLPLFIFVYFMWSYDPKEKVRIIGLLAITLVIDIIWVLYWYSFWHSSALANWDTTLHSIVIFCSSINILLKVYFLNSNLQKSL